MSYLIYGAYGYTGTLIAERAVAQGHEPILAGRDAQTLRPCARRLNLESRVVSLSDRERLRGVLGEVPAVVHCAGPFAHTSAPMVAACLDTGTHYLDVTGEIPVLQALMARDAEATRKEVLLLPAVGFDVVPTDCLARLLAEQMPSATSLEIAFVGQGGVSTGTLKTAVEQMGEGGRVRRGGRVVPVPSGWTSRRVSFGDRPRTVVSIPWGDVVTAGRSTGIPNVTVYTALPGWARRLLPYTRYVQGLLEWPPLQALLKRAVERWGPTPTAADRERGSTRVWASVRNDRGERREARLRGPEAYVFTARTAVAAAARVVDGPPAVGTQTPATALGPSFVSGIEGVEVEADPPAAPAQ
ncbi:MAG: trans-acting enoyl reductase family protein [Salinibacter sp.]